MKTVNVNVSPGDGYWFLEQDGTRITAPSSWHGVVVRVARYRKRNKMAPGDPKKEVYDQACARSPGNCIDENPAHTAALKTATLKTRVLTWLSRLREQKAREPVNLVDPQTAQARAGVCLGCPEHTTIAGGCGSCKRALREARGGLLEGRGIDDRLHGCRVLGEDTAVSTHLEELTVENGALPACCWRRRSAP